MKSLIQLSQELENLKNEVSLKIKELEQILSEKISGNDIQLNSDISTVINDNGLITSSVNKNLLDKFIEIVKDKEEHVSKFKQLIDYSSDPDNFVLAPYELAASPSKYSATIKWSECRDVSLYDVYYRVFNTGNFKKVGSTPALGLTIPKLSPNTYEVYVISIGNNGLSSAPSKTITFKIN